MIAPGEYLCVITIHENNHYTSSRVTYSGCIDVGHNRSAQDVYQQAITLAIAEGQRVIGRKLKPGKFSVLFYHLQPN